jgi:hypothetical protein
VGLDTLRQGFEDHTYVKVAGNNYDACLRADVDMTTRFWHFVLAVLWLLTFQFDRSRWHCDRAHGVTTDLPQLDYERLFIDTSTPPEAGLAGGQPAPEALDFSVV